MTVERRRRLAATRETSFPELKSYFKVSECWVHLKVPGQIAEVSQINIKWYPLNDSAQFASFSIMGKSINDVCNISGSLDSLQQDRFISAVCWGFRQVCLLMLANTAIWCPFCPHWVHGNTSYHSCEPFLLAQILRSIFMQPSLPLAPPHCRLSLWIPPDDLFTLLRSSPLATVWSVSLHFHLQIATPNAERAPSLTVPPFISTLDRNKLGCEK